MAAFTYNTISRFSAKIRYKLEVFIDAYQMFVENNVPELVRYYSTPEVTIDVNNFNMLDLLLAQAVKISNVVKINRNKFNLIDEWELATYLEDITLKLQTYDNLSRWMRSNKTKNSWRSLSIQSNYTLGQGETLEEVQDNTNPDGNEQNQWVQLSLENNLLESDYTTEGGNVLRVSKIRNTSPNLFLESVVDNLSGENLYGKDLHRQLTFVNDDLLCLAPVATVRQSVDILINLNKKDIPELPDFGKQPVIGSNVATFLYSGMVRQLNEVFASDDTMRNFSVKRFFYKDGDLYLEYSVDTFYHQTLENEAKIS